MRKPKSFYKRNAYLTAITTKTRTIKRLESEVQVLKEKVAEIEKSKSLLKFLENVARNKDITK